YTIFGYDVYVGEVLLCMAAIIIIGLLCSRSSKIPGYIAGVLALVFTLAVFICAVVALAGHAGGGASFDPVYIPDKDHIRQIVRIAVISPWAFIGFENVAHFSEEFAFPVKKARGVLLTSIILTTLFYIMMTLLSVTAYPERFGSWLEYIRNMGQLEGLESLPAFYAAAHYMGDMGVTLLLLALFSVIITSLIGNLLAISRLIYAFCRNHRWAERLGQLNKYHIPGRAIYFVVVITCLIPFLGRTAIGWIVDVTTLGATIIYGFLSEFVFCDAKRRGDKREEVTGIIGMAIMIIFAILLLAPKIMSYEAMASESYLLFAAWGLLGLMVFRYILLKDKENHYGKSIVVWIVLLLLILLSVMMWENKGSQQITDESMVQIEKYYQQRFYHGQDPGVDAHNFLQEEGQRIEDENSRRTLASFGIFIVAVALMLNNFHTAKKREKILQQQLGEALEFGLTDDLTGVKNKHAYVQWEEKVDASIEAGEEEPFAVAVCDINNLKKVNDTFGHAEGDECIKQASAHICRIFAHSPVFRYGGDEFVVLLFGEDYDNRKHLVTMVSEGDNKNAFSKGRTISVGLADYVKNDTKTLLAVFEKADRAMYDRKKEMKEMFSQST
ncbi:MAG: amino acid permease, partial [Lachnospiraceae bacterium]|nr:amino acid permease [Lachnospiraceae bacterium]